MMEHEKAAQKGVEIGVQLGNLLRLYNEAGLCKNCMVSGIVTALMSVVLQDIEKEFVDEFLNRITESIKYNLQKMGEAEASPSSSDKRLMN